ncbi:MAG: GLPGLI family protein [Dysgonamonadaceae bacterium]|jgi:GLPGLI family protein|nr:GLPGLI family protein [Dysgonamonadaceae bacterium]
MKQSFFVILLSVSISAFSQNYEAQYLSPQENDTIKLIFNSSEWNFYVYSSYTISISSDDFDVSDLQKDQKPQPDSKFMYYSLDQNTFYPYYTDEYAIIEELKKPEWEIISDSIKTIVNYQCVMAKTDLCGHKTIVWFTPDIPMSCGPWRLWGLPGYEYIDLCF